MSKVFIIDTKDEHDKYYKLVIDTINTIKENTINKIKNKIKEEKKVIIEQKVKTYTIKENEIIYLSKIKNPSLEECINAINRDAFEIKEVKEQIPELCMLAINKNPYSIKHIKRKYLTDDICKLAINLNWKSIQFIKNPNLIIIEYAIKHNACSIQFIKNLNRNFYEMAIKSYASVIQYIPNTLPYYYSLCKLAVSIHGSSIQYINDPSIEICEISIDTYAHSLKYIELQTFDLCKQAIDKDWKTFVHIKNKTYYLCEYTIMKNGMALNLIPKKYFNRLKKQAVKNNGNAIQYIPNPSNKLIDYALRERGNSIIYIPPTLDNIKKSINSFQLPDKLEYDNLNLLSNDDIFRYYEKNAINNNLFLNNFDVELFKKLDFTEYKIYEKFNIVEEMIIELFFISINNALEYIDYTNVDDKFINYIIKLDCSNIKYIKNPSQELCNNVFKQNINTFYDIPDKNKTIEMCDNAIITIFNLTIYPKEYITLELCKKLINRNLNYFPFIPNEFINELDYLNIIKQKPEYIIHLPKELLTKSLLCQYIAHRPTYINTIDKEYITKDLIMIAFNNKHYDALKYLDEELTFMEWKDIISRYGSSIKYLNSKFSENEMKELEFLAVDKYGSSIKYIKNQSPELQLQALYSHIDSFQYFINPSLDIIKKLSYKFNVDQLKHIDINYDILLYLITVGRYLNNKYIKNIIKYIDEYEFTQDNIINIFNIILSNKSNYPYLKYYKYEKNYELMETAVISNSFNYKYKCIVSKEQDYILLRKAISNIESNNKRMDHNFNKLIYLYNYEITNEQLYELYKIILIKYPDFIGYIMDDFKTECLIELSLKRDISNLRFIDCPNDKICKMALDIKFNAISWIKEPSYFIKEYAIIKNSSNILKIHKKTYYLWNLVLKQDPLLIKEFNINDITHENNKDNIKEIDLYYTFLESIKQIRYNIFTYLKGYKFPTWLPLNYYEQLLINNIDSINNINWTELELNIDFCKRIFKLNKNIIKFLNKKFDIKELFENKIILNNNNIENISFTFEDDDYVCPICVNPDNKYFFNYSCLTSKIHIICFECSVKYDKCYFCRNTILSYDKLYIKN